MKTSLKVLIDNHGCENIDSLQRTYLYSGDCLNKILASMREYAEDYHRNEINKLNKSDVSRSANIQSCKECGIFVFTPDGKMCMNGHFC